MAPFSGEADRPPTPGKAACGRADIFVDVHRLAGETEETFRRRRDELEAAVRHAHGEGVNVVLRERP
jgi:hypothetical protein